MTALGAPAHEDRHDDVVADHDRQRDGFDDDHGGRSRKAAEKGDQCHALAACGDRQGENIGVAVGGGRAQEKQSRNCDRHDENVDRHQIDGKQPCGAAQIGAPGILDDRNMELARQEYDREHGEQGHGDPPPAIEALRKEVRHGWCRSSRLVEGHRAVGKDEGDEGSDRDEGDQLDDRFNRDRQHHAMLMLGRVDVAGAEQDREGGHGDGDEKGQILCGRIDPADGTRRDQGLERERDGLQLDGNVGNNADHRDDCHQGAEHFAFAIACGDEIGDRGDVLPLGQIDDALQDGTAKSKDENRSQIDRQEIETRA